MGRGEMGKEGLRVSEGRGSEAGSRNRLRQRWPLRFAAVDVADADGDGNGAAINRYSGDRPSDPPFLHSLVYTSHRSPQPPPFLASALAPSLPIRRL